MNAWLSIKINLLNCWENLSALGTKSAVSLPAVGVSHWEGNGRRMKSREEAAQQLGCKEDFADLFWQPLGT